MPRTSQTSPTQLSLTVCVLFSVLTPPEYADRGEFDYEDLLTIGQVVYNDVAIERALVLALRKLTPPGAKSVPRAVLRDMLLNLGVFFSFLIHFPPQVFISGGLKFH